jgi:hypothetical protein
MLWPGPDRVRRILWVGISDAVNMLGKSAARHLAAKALQIIFPQANFEALKHWQNKENKYPPTPDDEQLIAEAIELHGHDAVENLTRRHRLRPWRASMPKRCRRH